MLKSVEEVMSGLGQGLSSDLVTVDLRTALYHLGEITREITTDDIFGKFCVVK
jgi:tRNA modification GTPase